LNVLGLFEDRPVSIRLVERVRAVDWPLSPTAAQE
jgi:hypothetical protein